MLHSISISRTSLCTRQATSARTLSFRQHALPRDDFGPKDAERMQEVVTFITADGVVRFPGHIIKPAKRQAARSPRLMQPMPTWEEQKLCIGASFAVEGRNPIDPTRRIGLIGFCQSVDMLLETVQETVVYQGGEILHQQRELKSGLHEVLKLTVALPQMWGVPPTLEYLREAIVIGGGAIEKVVMEWRMGTPLPPFRR